MNKRKTIIILGILIALMPFLGFPNIIENNFFVIAGLWITIVVYYGDYEPKKCCGANNNRCCKDNENKQKTEITAKAIADDFPDASREALKEDSGGNT